MPSGASIRQPDVRDARDTRDSYDSFHSLDSFDPFGHVRAHLPVPPHTAGLLGLPVHTHSHAHSHAHAQHHVGDDHWLNIEGANIHRNRTL
jgi:hypothetical protein